MCHNLFARRYYCHRRITAYYYGNPNFNKKSVDIVLRRVSENYYNFRISQQLQADTYYDPLAEPVLVYSNVENGLGVFGSYVQSKLTYQLELQF